MREPNRDNDVTIGIPVGPEKHHAKYLKAAFASVLAIPEKPTVLLIDDMHGLEPEELGLNGSWKQWSRELDQFVGRDGPVSDRAGPILRYLAPWRMGVAQAFNLCSALAPTQFVLMMGADDTLEPDVISMFHQECPFPLRERALRTFWGLPLRYMDTGEEQNLPCNAAIVPRDLWNHTGGFSPQMGVGAPDSMYLSILIGNGAEAGDIRMVGDRPLYNYRRHGDTETARSGDVQASIFQIRDLLTSSWRPTSWGRYFC
jgi:hypothetical protein